VGITAGKPSFAKGYVKTNHPALYEEYLRIEALKCSFSWVGKPRINAYPEIRAQLNAAKAAKVTVEPEDVDLATQVERTDTLATLHAEFLEHTAALARVKDELVLYELEIRHTCGTHGGVEGMCKYKREVTHDFDAEAFEADHPQIHAAAMTERPAQTRITVLKARDYA
jgi:hypothetical protein